jgi:hypothetical protein
MIRPNPIVNGFILTIFLLIVGTPVLLMISSIVSPITDPFTGKPESLHNSWMGGVLLWGVSILSGIFYSMCSSKLALKEPNPERSEGMDRILGIIFSAIIIGLILIIIFNT